VRKCRLQNTGDGARANVEEAVYRLFVNELNRFFKE